MIVLIGMPNFTPKVGQILEFRVPAVPVAQPRQRQRTITPKGGGKGFQHNYTPTKHPVNAFKATIRQAFADANGDKPPLHGMIYCSAVFLLPRPKRLIWKSRPMPRVPYDQKPDRDNLDKGLLDSLKGLAWDDDAQAFAGPIEKYFAAGDEQPGVLVTIAEILSFEPA